MKLSEAMLLGNLQQGTNCTMFSKYETTIYACAIGNALAATNPDILNYVFVGDFDHYKAAKEAFPCLEDDALMQSIWYMNDIERKSIEEISAYLAEEGF
jgi:hypothetical protein